MEWRHGRWPFASRWPFRLRWPISSHSLFCPFRIFCPSDALPAEVDDLLPDANDVPAADYPVRLLDDRLDVLQHVGHHLPVDEHAVVETKQTGAKSRRPQRKPMAWGACSPAGKSAVYLGLSMTRATPAPYN